MRDVSTNARERSESEWFLSELSVSVAHWHLNAWGEAECLVIKLGEPFDCQTMLTVGDPNLDELNLYGDINSSTSLTTSRYACSGSSRTNWTGCSSMCSGRTSNGASTATWTSSPVHCSDICASEMLLSTPASTTTSRIVQSLHVDCRNIINGIPDASFPS